MCCVKCKRRECPGIWESRDSWNQPPQALKDGCISASNMYLNIDTYVLLFSYGHNSYIQRNDVM